MNSGEKFVLILFSLIALIPISYLLSYLTGYFNKEETPQPIPKTVQECRDIGGVPFKDAWTGELSYCVSGDDLEKLKKLFKMRGE